MLIFISLRRSKQIRKARVALRLLKDSYNVQICAGVIWPGRLRTSQSLKNYAAVGSQASVVATEHLLIHISLRQMKRIGKSKQVVWRLNACLFI